MHSNEISRRILLGVITLSALLTMGASCTPRVMPTNLTAATFPEGDGYWIGRFDQALETQVHQVGTGAAKNRFHLGVRWAGWNGDDIQARIYVDGSEHLMTRGSSYVWYFDPESVCQHYENYRYWFKVTGKGGRAVATLGSEAQPFEVQNPYGQAVYWFAPGLTHGNREVGTVSESVEGTVDIVLRNASGKPVTLHEAALVSRSEPGITLQGVPTPMPHPMTGCEDVTLRVARDFVSTSLLQSAQLKLLVVDYNLPPGTHNAASQLQATARIEFHVAR